MNNFDYSPKAHFFLLIIYESLVLRYINLFIGGELNPLFELDGQFLLGYSQCAHTALLTGNLELSYAKRVDSFACNDYIVGLHRIQVNKEKLDNFEIR